MYFRSDGEVPVLRDKNTPIGQSELYPSYSDRRFILPSRHRTVFLAPDAVLVQSEFGYERVEDANYVNSISALAGQSDAWAAAMGEHDGQDDGYERTAAFYEALLGRILDKTLEIRHILAAVNVGGDGFAYQDFGVKYL